MSSLPSARIVIDSADNCEDSNTYPSGACGNSPSTNDTSVPSGKLTPAETTEPSAGRSNSADPSAHVAITGNVVPSGNSPASTPESTFRKLNVPSATSSCWYVLRRVTSWVSPAAISKDSGENSAPVKVYPSRSGTSISSNDTTVPTGRSCGPATTDPSTGSANSSSMASPSTSHDATTVKTVSPGKSPASTPSRTFTRSNPPTSTDGSSET